jgi:hypothetical protein
MCSRRIEKPDFSSEVLRSCSASFRSVGIKLFRKSWAVWSSSAMEERRSSFFPHNECSRRGRERCKALCGKQRSAMTTSTAVYMRLV